MPASTNVKFVADADFQRAIAGINKTIAAQEKLIAKLRQTNAEAKKTANTGDQAATAFSGMGTSLRSSIANIVGLSAAIGGATAALSEFQSRRESAAGGIKSEERTRKQLLQLAGDKTNAKDFERMINVSKLVSLQSGVEINRAQDLVFKSKSIGLTEEESARVGKYKRFTDDVRPLAGSIGGIRKAFSKDSLGGSIESSMNALFAGAELAQATLNQMATAVLTPAKSVQRLGFTAKESIAALGELSGALPSVEEASTALGRAGDVLARDKRFKGKGLLAILDTLEGMSEREIEDVVGENVRARRGIGVLRDNAPQIRENLKRIESAIDLTGTQQSEFNVRNRKFENDSQLVKAEASNKERIRLELQEREGKGEDELVRQRARDRLQTTMDEAGYGPIRQFMSKRAAQKGPDFMNIGALRDTEGYVDMLATEAAKIQAPGLFKDAKHDELRDAFSAAVMDLGPDVDANKQIIVLLETLVEQGYRPADNQGPPVESRNASGGTE